MTMPLPPLAVTMKPALMTDIIAKPWAFAMIWAKTHIKHIWDQTTIYKSQSSASCVILTRNEFVRSSPVSDFSEVPQNLGSFFGLRLQVGWEGVTHCKHQYFQHLEKIKSGERPFCWPKKEAQWSSIKLLVLMIVFCLHLWQQKTVGACSFWWFIVLLWHISITVCGCSLHFIK